MGIKERVKKNVLKIWDDIYEARLDDKAAPNLCDVCLEREESIYAEPEEFFKRTYMTKTMSELTEEISESLKGGKGSRIFLLTSLFGGGKTHTLIALYHMFKDPDKIKSIDKRLAAKAAESGKVEVIVMDASSSKLVPHPDEPYRAEDFTIKTIWGMLAYKLGAYARVRNLDSEDAPAPDIEPLKAVLSDTKGPVLILLDEIVHYIFNMYKSRLRDYGEKVLLFLDYLARAVEASPNVVLVASVQAEYRISEGQKTLIEEEMFKGYAEKVLKSLTRESTRIIMPVTPDDVVKVLKRRIFKEIPETVAWEAQDKLHRFYREAPELFGVESDWQFSPSETGRVASATETYPFHPKYVEVLQEFVSRNRDLQKTRDAIRITRKVVRRILHSPEEAEFIMPWHIDLRDNDIRARVLTDSYREFRDVASRDIVSEDGRLGSVTDCSKPQLALRIASTILLKTYTYETFKEPLKVFPDLKTIGLMVYEPETFASEELQPTDIKTIIDEMQGRLPHFVTENGRYWFTPYPSVLEYVGKRAEEKLKGPRLELYRVLKAHVKGMLVRRGREGEMLEGGELFSERNTTIISYGDEIWEGISVEDNASMKLVVFVRPDVKGEDVRKIVLTKPEGGRRTFGNTVTVVQPRSGTEFESLLRYAAGIKAAEEVRDALSEYYSDKDIRSLQEKKLKNFIQDNENLLTQQLLSVLTRVAYPHRDAEGDHVKFTDATPSSSIIGQLEAALKDPQTGPKLRTDFTFSDLVDFLKSSLGWDLVEGNKRFEFRDILQIFYTNTVAPFTTRKAVQQAILSGVETLDIGVKAAEKLCWKRIGPEDGAEIPEKVEDMDEILPYKIAAKLLSDKLLSETRTERTQEAVKKVWFEVEISGRKVPLEGIVRQEGWEKALKEGIIFRREQVFESGFLIDLKPGSLEAKPKEEVKVAVSVEPVGLYSEEITLEVKEGTLSTHKGRLPLTTDWSLTLPENPGNYTFILKGVGTDGTVKEGTLSVNVLSPEVEIEVDRIDLTQAGAKLLSISQKDLLPLRMAIDIISKLNLKASAEMTINFGKEASFSAASLNVEVARLFVQKFDEIFRLLTQLRIETAVESIVNFDEPVILDSSKITVLTSLNGKAKFKLRVKRE